MVKDQISTSYVAHGFLVVESKEASSYEGPKVDFNSHYCCKVACTGLAYFV